MLRRAWASAVCRCRGDNRIGAVVVHIVMIGVNPRQRVAGTAINPPNRSIQRAACRTWLLRNRSRPNTSRKSPNMKSPSGACTRIAWMFGLMRCLASIVGGTKAPYPSLTANCESIGVANRLSSSAIARCQSDNKIVPVLRRFAILLQHMTKTGIHPGRSITAPWIVGSRRVFITAAFSFCIIAGLAGCATQANPSFPTNLQAASSDLDRMQAAPHALHRPLLIIGGMLDPGFSTTFLRARFGDITGDKRVISVPIGECLSIDACCEKAIRAVDEPLPPRRRATGRPKSTSSAIPWAASPHAMRACQRRTDD